MKKRPKIAYFLLFCLLYTSCGMYKTSFFRNSQRNIQEIMQNGTTTELLKLARSPEVLGDENVAIAVLNAFSLRSETLVSLPINDKNAIFDLGTASILPISSIINALQELQKSTKTNENAITIISNILLNIPQTNNNALTILLSNKQTVELADISSIMMATASLLISSVAYSGLESTSIEIKNFLQEIALAANPDNEINLTPAKIQEIITNTLGNTIQRLPVIYSQITASLTALNTLKNRPDYETATFAGISMSSILGSWLWI